MNWEVIIRRNISWDDLEAEQASLIKKVKANPETGYLLFSEPSSTFTFGPNSDPAELLWSKDLLEAHRVQISPVSRGGKWTYHGPGQILLYPILHLPTLGYTSKSVRLFLEDFRTGVREALGELGIQNLSSQEPFGLYINQKKLVSFGVAFQRGISSHGMALYLEDQSLYFSGITPCGVSGGLATNLVENISQKITWDSVTKLLAHAVKNRFSLRISQVL
jgi:lipoate-protein ligase B